MAHIFGHLDLFVGRICKKGRKRRKSGGMKMSGALFFHSCYSLRIMVSSNYGGGGGGPLRNFNSLIPAFAAFPECRAKSPPRFSNGGKIWAVAKLFSENTFRRRRRFSRENPFHLWHPRSEKGRKNFRGNRSFLFPHRPFLSRLLTSSSFPCPINIQVGKE